MGKNEYRISSAWIIHSFALLHAGLAIACRACVIDDSILLTLMTMLMTLLLCFRHGLNLELTAANIILVNVFGFLLGIGFATLFGRFLHTPMLEHSIATFITTEILGWVVYLLSGFWATRSKKDAPGGMIGKMKWIVAACLAILLARYLFTEVISRFYLSTDEILSVFAEFIFNAPVLFILVCLNLIYVRFSSRKLKDRGFAVKTSWFAIFFISASCLMALITGFGMSSGSMEEITPGRYLVLFLPSAVIEITIYFVIYLLNYAFSAQEEMLEQREKAQIAEYQYFRLKQQVNPHFLFNSLNILDGIVCGDNPQQASVYIHKLSSIYRYMLSNDGNIIVPLKDELVFVGLYVDLLKVRFPEGLNVELNIRQEDMNRRVVPCAVQLLVENAVKHNAVGAGNVLTVTISSDGDSLSVKNNICPKMSAVSSTGVGQKYIKSEYMRWSGKSVTVTDTGTEYIFTLPLL